MKKGTYRKQFELEGKVAVVTGGAGILGRRFCAGLLDFGAKVAVVDLDEDEAKEVANNLKSEFGIKCIGVCCDVANKSSVKSMVDRVTSELGEIGILHNNAASKSSDLKSFFAPVEDFSLDTWSEVMSVNLDGMFLVAQAIGSGMAARGMGSIIQTASIYGEIAPDQRIYEGSDYMGCAINTPPVYSASKAGVIGLTRYLATYWATKGVRVNTLSPGGVESGQNTVFNKCYSNRIPMERMAKGDEMISTLIYLASDASSYITGQNIMVDGGLSAW